MNALLPVSAGSSEPLPSLSPLVVDLDGTLVRTDTLHETFLLLLKQSPLTALFLVPLWLLMGGKAHLKAEIARRVSFDGWRLPFDADVLALCRAEKAAGRRLILATAADRRIAEAVSTQLGLFDEVLASDGRTNLDGTRKLDAVQALIGRGVAFWYAGDSKVDLPLWRASEHAITVGRNTSLQRQVEGIAPRFTHIASPGRRLKRWVKAIRVHQWAKNVLVFVPLLAGHHLEDRARLLHAALACVAFSLCASSVYLLNDLLDLPSDRRHPTKRRRPFAAGELPVKDGLLLAPVLLAGAFALSLWQLPLAFSLLLAGYYAITLAYSLTLKQVLMLDVLILAGLYTIRLLGGSLAVDVATSSWLFTFSMFLFLSLALVKRVSEVRKLRLAEATRERENDSQVHGRGYAAGDWEQLGSLGSASGYLAVLVLALFISSAEVRLLYAHPERLWLLCPLMLYWVGRIWMLAHRGLVNDDPLVFALKDRASYVVCVLGAVVVVASS